MKKKFKKRFWRRRKKKVPLDAMSSFVRYFKAQYKKRCDKEATSSEHCVDKFLSMVEGFPSHDYTLLVDTFFDIGYSDPTFELFVSRFKTLKNFIEYKRLRYFPKYLRTENV